MNTLSRDCYYRNIGKLHTQSARPFVLQWNPASEKRTPMNTKSTRRSYTRASQFWECGQFLPFNIKRIFPCSFENNCIRLLTCVYGIPEAPELGTPCFNSKMLGPNGICYRGVPLYTTWTMLYVTLSVKINYLAYSVIN